MVCTLARFFFEISKLKCVNSAKVRGHMSREEFYDRHLSGSNCPWGKYSGVIIRGTKTQWGNSSEEGFIGSYCPGGINQDNCPGKIS